MINILVVDDSALARKRIIETLSKFEIEYSVVGEASDGEEAIVLFKKLQPNLVITDVEMPNMNGVDLVKEIRNIDKNINIIVISSVSNAQIQQTLKSDKFLYCVKKPIKSELLSTTLHRVENFLKEK